MLRELSSQVLIYYSTLCRPQANFAFERGHMFRRFLVLAIACAVTTGCNSSKSLSDSELEARILKDTFELQGVFNSCIAGDVQKCEDSIDKADAVLALQDEACSRSIESAGCKAKPPIEKVAKAIPLYRDLAKGNLTALKKLSTLMLDKPSGELSDNERVDAAVEAADRAAEAADVAARNAKQDADPIRFDSYMTEVFGGGEAASPILTGGNPPNSRYKAAIEEAVMDDPVYAGSYSVVRLGCGTACEFIKFVNQKNGVVVDLPRDLQASPHDISHMDDSLLLKVTTYIDSNLTNCRFDDLVIEEDKFRTVRNSSGPCPSH